MKILFLMRFWPFFGGGETVTRLLANEFLNRGHQVIIGYWWDRYEKREYSDEKKIVRVKIVVPSPSETNDIQSSCYNFVYKQLCALIKEYDIDIAINQWWPYQIFNKGLNIPLISCHHLNVLKAETNVLKYIYHAIFKNRYYKKAFEKLDGLYQKSDALVFLAKSYKEEYEKNTTGIGVNTYFIHNPSTYTKTCPIQMLKKKKEILFVGRIYEDHKKVSRILYMWNYLRQKGYHDWILKFVGNGPDLDNIKALCSDLKLSNIKFLGAKDPYEDYLSASIFILTSQVEGWPMTIVEAQHFGAVPVVMNNFSALDEMLSDNSGVIVNSSDPMKMAIEIAKLINDKHRMKIISQNAIRKSEQYNVSLICDEWEMLINKIIKKYNENHILQ